jgi:hypothetical protein
MRKPDSRPKRSSEAERILRLPCGHEVGVPNGATWMLLPAAVSDHRGACRSVPGTSGPPGWRVEPPLGTARSLSVPSRSREAILGPSVFPTPARMAPRSRDFR